MENLESQLSRIQEFLEQHSSLTVEQEGSDQLKITQSVDGKSLSIKKLGIDEVMHREDSNGKPFLQINFLEGTKILLTQNLIGFKPAVFEGVDPKRIPNVVTTPDLLSIVEAMSEFDIHDDYEEFRALRRMYYSILQGAEAVGFEISNEKLWISQMQIGAAAA